MFRSRSSLQQHTNKYIQKNALNRNGTDSSTSRNALESQTLHDGSHLLPCFPNKPFRHPLHSSLHQISSQQTSMQHTVSASGSTHAQSSRSEPLLSQHVLHEFPSSSQQTSMQHTLELEDDESEDKLIEVEIIGNVQRSPLINSLLFSIPC